MYNIGSVLDFSGIDLGDSKDFTLQSASLGDTFTRSRRDSGYTPKIKCNPINESDEYRLEQDDIDWDSSLLRSEDDNEDEEDI